MRFAIEAVNGVFRCTDDRRRVFDLQNLGCMVLVSTAILMRMNFLDLLRLKPADDAWAAIGRRMAETINLATAEGDPKAAAYFTSQRGSPSVYVPLGFQVADLFGISTESDAYVSSRGRGFKHHKSRIKTLVAPYRVTSCFADPRTQNITFAYEAEMSIIAGVPELATRGCVEFSDEAEKTF